jgi:hypothetical protein
MSPLSPLPLLQLLTPFSPLSLVTPVGGRGGKVENLAILVTILSHNKELNFDGSAAQ